MRRHLGRLVIVSAFVALVFGNVYVASAHNWWNWHWNKSGTQITIRQSHAGGTTAQAEAARVDAWNKIGILYNYRVDYHTDVSVFDGNFGNTGWAGLASIESKSWDWGCWCYAHIDHAHARYNTYYGYSSWYIQGIYCQEVFHTYGFDHNSSGGCMGLGYFSGQGNTLTSHDVNDFYGRYRNH